MRKYYLYARKSMDNEDKQILSIEAQLVELNEYIKRIPDIEIVEEFVETRTAKEPGRPIFNKMIAQVEKGAVEGIVAWHPDRLARNSVDGGKIIHLVDRGLIKYLDFPTYRFDNTSQGKFMLNIIFGQSKYYVDNLSENVKRGIRQKLRRGEYPSFAPPGYLNNYKTRKIDVDPVTAPKVKSLFEMYATGRYAFEHLIPYASSMGILSRRTGRALSVCGIQSILQNPFYYGFIRYNGEYYEGIHTPLIDKDLYARVQEVIKQRGRRPRKIVSKKPFTGLIKCEICGAMVTAEVQKGHTYYRCTKKKGHCSGGYIRQERLVDQIDDSIKRVIVDPELGTSLKDKVSEEKETLRNSTAKDIKRLDKCMTVLENKISRLMDIYLEGEISKYEYCKRKQKLLDEKYDLQKQVNMLEKGQYLWLELLEEFINGLGAANFALSSDSLEEKRQFLENIGSNFSLGLVASPAGAVRGGKGGGFGDTKVKNGGGGGGFGNVVPAIKNGSKTKCPQMRLRFVFKNLWGAVAEGLHESNYENEPQKSLCSVWWALQDSNL